MIHAHYKCSICRKAFPSPEAGNAHLQKRHSGGGYLSWIHWPVDDNGKKIKMRRGEGNSHDKP